MAEPPNSQSSTSQGADNVAIGRILRPWGLRGALKVEVTTDFPQRLSPGSQFTIRGQVYRCEESRVHGSAAVLKLQGVDSLEQAESLRGSFLEVPQSQVSPLPEGTYYHFEIIGMEVWTTSGQYLGRVAEILATGSNDVYLVRGTGGEVLIPATTDVIQQVNVEERRITVAALPGLL
ncbi:MAG: 16S rRNA processing protein RimM [Chloroflexi bacterium]|nr:16S rRNA processing protein RimM [Chloroflexota bacterium]